MSAMKRVLFTIAFLAITQTVATAQTQTKDSSTSPSSAGAESAAVRTRIVGPKVANHADRQRSPAARTAADSSTPEAAKENSAVRWGNTAVSVTEPAASATVSTANLSPRQSLQPVIPANATLAEVTSKVV